MARGTGLGLKTLQWFLRLIEFASAAIILGIFAWFIWELHHHHVGVPKWTIAVEAISGAAVIYLIFALMLLCCLGGIAFFSFLAFVLDILFLGAFVWVTYRNRHGANSCSGYVRTPLGNGQGNNRLGGQDTNGSLLSNSSGPKLHTACKLETVVFSFAIITIFFLLLSAILELLLYRNHRKEKGFGPSPNNGYTKGSTNERRRMPWQRNGAVTQPTVVHPDTLPAHQTPADMTVRQSAATDTTAVNAHGHNGVGGVGGVGDKYDQVGNGNNGTFGIGDGQGHSHHGGATNGNAAGAGVGAGAGGYDRYATPSAGHHQTTAAGGIPSEIPVSEYARNY